MHKASTDDSPKSSRYPLGKNPNGEMRRWPMMGRAAEHNKDMFIIRM